MRDLWKLIKALLLIAAIAAVVMGFILLLESAALAEDGEMWVVCGPESWVNIRERANRHSPEAGQLYLGDRVKTDGIRRNGFVHIVDASNESGEGWVNAGYLIADEPQMETDRALIIGKSRVAVRKTPGGERIRWAQPGEELTVYAWCNEWSVTSAGFVMTKYLEAQ